MAAPMENIANLALRGSQGILVTTGPPTLILHPEFEPCTSTACRVLMFSPDGSLMGFCDGYSVMVLSTQGYTTVANIPKPRTSALVFSPCNTVIATWEPYAVTKDQEAGTPNLNLWDVKTGKLLRGFVQKKNQGWQPQWTKDESVCARNVNNEVQFFENNDFKGSAAQKLHLQKVTDFSMSSHCPAPFHIAAYVPGTKGQPSFVRLYKYPNFGGPNAALANKSFYQADKVDLLWNNKGSVVLLLTATDMSADSYYGDQGLHFVSLDGESCLVPRGKNGPVYSIEWNPNSTDFCVVYGFMPAKATLYSLKCEPIFDFGTGPRNLAYYNPQGTILCLAGFGNLRGNMEFWNVKGQSMISNPKAPDTTYFEWCPDGAHIVTATTSPRLRVGNGYKLWNISGELLQDRPLGEGKDLWDVTWQPAPAGLFPGPRLPKGIKPPTAAAPGNTAAAAKAEPQPKAYVPPALRNNPAGQTASAPKYREAYEPASNVKKEEAAAENLSKAALKNKKKRESKARAKAEAAESGNPAETNDYSLPPPGSVAPVVPPTAPAGSQDPEREKKIRNLKKKLQQITKLKEMKSAGKKLESNQLEKIESEDLLVAEMEDLQLS